MSLETSVYTALYSAGVRVYPDVTPPGTTPPFIVWQQVGGQAPSYLERAVVDKRNGIIQVECWAATRSAANALALAVESALIASTSLQVTPQGAFVAIHDTDLEWYGTSQDFSVWATR